MDTKEKLTKLFNGYMKSVTDATKDLVIKHKEYIKKIQDEVKNSDIDNEEFVNHMIKTAEKYQDSLSEEEADEINKDLENAISILSTGELNE